MGLDAAVYCDCVERKRLRVPHPHPKLLYVTRNGSPEIRSDDLAKLEAHDKWMEMPPCEHESMTVADCSLGNIATIHSVREVLGSVLRPSEPACPVLFERVLYSGSHTGDYLTMSQVRKLARELEKLEKIDFGKRGLSARDSALLVSVLRKLGKLTKAAREVNKPIAF